MSTTEQKKWAPHEWKKAFPKEGKLGPPCEWKKIITSSRGSVKKTKRKTDTCYKTTSLDWRRRQRWGNAGALENRLQENSPWFALAWLIVRHYFSERVSREKNPVLRHTFTSRCKQSLDNRLSQNKCTCTILFLWLIEPLPKTCFKQNNIFWCLREEGAWNLCQTW